MTGENPERLGGCLCGAVRYRAEGPVLYATHCHCTLCRRASGAPLVSWATFPADGFHIVRGEPTCYASSPVAQRRFCPTCGTQITFQRRDRPWEIDLTIASLDQPERVVPTNHTWVRSRLPWLHVDGHLPCFEGDPV